MKKLFVLTILVCGITIYGYSQEVNILRVEKINTQNLTRGDIVTIGIYIDTYAEKIGALQLYLEYDRKVLDFAQDVNIHPEMASEWMSNDSEHFYASNWLTTEPKGVKFVEGDKLFDLEFKYLGGETDITWQTEQIVEDGKVVNGSTLMYNSSGELLPLTLMPGCVCATE